jgi:predicted acetyltransferase
MRELFLSVPSKQYQKSFKDYVTAYKNADDNYYFTKYKKGIENFDEYLSDLYKYSKGIDLPKGEVITSTFWLIDNNEVVGVVRVRHQDVWTDGHIGYDISPCYRKKGYGTQILKLALVEAGKIGIKEVMVTCNIDNIYSKKIIEKNNGKLLETIFDEAENENLYRYSIVT